MTAPTPAEQATIDRFEAAPAAEESLRERVIDALYDVRWPHGEPKLYMARKYAGELADAAIAVMRGDR